MTGSTKLTDEQQSFYTSKFQVKYVRVQDQPQVPSRKERRDMQFRPKKGT